MAGGMLSNLSFGWLSNIVVYAGWFILLMIVGLIMTAIVLFVLIKSKQNKVIEIDMENRGMKMFNGRDKKTKKKGVKHFVASKIGRPLPKLQSKDYLNYGKRKSAILFKDNNGLYHTARIPTYKQIKKWYKVVYDIDLDEEKEEYNPMRRIYLIPSPHEDVDWYADQCAEADKEFKAQTWWQHPNVMVVSAAAISAFVFIITIIVSKRM